MPGNGLSFGLRWVVSTVAVCGFLCVAQPQPAYACSPPLGGFPNYTVLDRVNAADVVLEGTIVGVAQNTPEFGLQIATVQVQRYLKGSGPSTVDIANFGQSSLCLVTAFVDDHWVFYVTDDVQAGFTANYLTAYDAVDVVNSRVLTLINVALGPKHYLPIILRNKG